MGKPDRMERRRFLAGLAALSPFLAGIGVAGCLGASKPREPLTEEEAAKVRLLGSGMPLPRGASEVWLFENSAMDSVQMIRFDAFIGEARTFAEAALGKPLKRGYDTGIQNFGSGFDWWIKHHSLDSEGGERNTGNPPGFRITLLPMGGKARVWIVLFTT